MLIKYLCGFVILHLKHLLAEYFAVIEWILDGKVYWSYVEDDLNIRQLLIWCAN